jgi:hypothetical protein
MGDEDKTDGFGISHRLNLLFGIPCCADFNPASFRSGRFWNVILGIFVARQFLIDIPRLFTGTPKNTFDSKASNEEMDEFKKGSQTRTNCTERNFSFVNACRVEHCQDLLPSDRMRLMQ